MEAHFLKAAACALVFLLFAFVKGGPEVQAQEQRSYDPALFEELAETSDDGQGDGLEEDLREIEEALVTSEEMSYPPPMLIDQLGYLYGMTTRADQKPGQDAFERYDELREELDGVLRQWEEVQAQVSE